MTPAKSFSGKVPFRKTVRGRLLFSALLVEALMLILLVGNCLRLLNEHMNLQERRHASELSPILLAALVAPMAQRDYATIQAILSESTLENGIKYMVVKNNHGVVVASHGLDATKSMPEHSQTYEESINDADKILDVVKPITLSEQHLGTLHFGLDLSPIVSARGQMLMQGFSIASLELLLSVAMLTALGIWLTRHLTALTRVSEDVSRGGIMPSILPTDDSDIGRLCAAFNAMTKTVSDRVHELTTANQRQSALAEKLQEQQSQMLALLSAMNLGVLLLDLNGKVAYENRAFREMMGIGEKQVLIGLQGIKYLLSSIPNLPDSFEAECQALEQASASRSLQIISPGGRYISLRLHNVVNNEGLSIGKLLLFDDISDNKQAEQQLIAARDAAEAGSRVRAAFLATMSHEIRTPMNGIIGMTDLILKTSLNDEQREYLGWIKSSSDSLLTVLNDILDYSKIDSGQLALEQIPFSAAELLKETAGLYSAVSNQKGIRIVYSIDGDIPEYVLGDSVRTRQILMNLVANAVKFTETGEVTIAVSAVKVSPTKYILQFMVADTGIGIPQEKQQSIFSPFTQADSSTSRKYGGTGLGLAIVKRLVDLQKGTITLESSPGKGSRFTVELPFNTPHQSASSPGKAAPSASKPASDTQAMRILLVEDVPVSQRLGQLVLEGLGHQVKLASDGIEAVSAFEQETFDVILMDMQMPNMDGLEATRQIRAKEKTSHAMRTPIIAVTANAMDSDRVKCLESGMDDYISKPFKLEEMVSMLHKYRPA